MLIGMNFRDLEIVFRGCSCSTTNMFTLEIAE